MKDLDLLLAAYADGELTPEAVDEVERILAIDPAARRTVELHRGTTSLLRAALAEPAFATDATTTPNLPRGMWASRHGWAVAASLAIGIVGFGGGTLWSSLEAPPLAHFLDEVAEYHAVFSRETTHLVEVPATEINELQAWLGERIGRKLAVPDLSGAGLRFAGGRMLVIDSAPVAELVYTRADGPPIALCIGGRQGKPAPIQHDRRGTMHLAYWTEGAHTFAFVGQADASRLLDYARQVKDQGTALGKG